MTMRRSEIFMMSYCLFLSITTTIAFLMDDNSTINKVALCATIASFFFSSSDCLNEIGTNVQKVIAPILNDLDSFKRNSNALPSDVLQRVRKLECQALKSQKKAKVYRRTGSILFALGAFCFLTSLAFYDENTAVFMKLIAIEKPLTIFAFSFVILSYFAHEQFTSLISKSLIEESNEINNTIC